MSKNEGLESLQCSKCGHAYSSDSQIVITPIKFNLQQFKNGQIKPFNGSLVGHSHLECNGSATTTTNDDDDSQKLEEIRQLLGSEWALKTLLKNDDSKKLLEKLGII